MLDLQGQGATINGLCTPPRDVLLVAQTNLGVKILKRSKNLASIAVKELGQMRNVTEKNQVSFLQKMVVSVENVFRIEIQKDLKHTFFRKI